MRVSVKIIALMALFFYMSSDLCAQVRKKKIPVKNYTAIDGIENVLIYRFNFDNMVTWSEIFISKNRDGIYIPYYFADSSNVINILHSYGTKTKWETSRFELDSSKKYNMRGMYPTIYGKMKYPTYVFYGDTILNYSIKSGYRSEWVRNRKVPVILGRKNNIIGVLSGAPGKSCILMNNTEPGGKNSIISVRSDDAGYNWNMPSIAVKHNLLDLRGWCVASKKKKVSSSYMIMTDRDNYPYYSHSGDGGISWSYPKRISSSLMGDNFRMSIDNGYVVIVFRSLASRKENESLVKDNNDIMLWHGTLAEFVSDTKDGDLVKIFDNMPYKGSDEAFIEDMVFHKNRRYYVLLKIADGNNTGSNLQLHLIKRN